MAKEGCPFRTVTFNGETYFNANDIISYYEKVAQVECGNSNLASQLVRVACNQLANEFRRFVRIHFEANISTFKETKNA